MRTPPRISAPLWIVAALGLVIAGRPALPMVNTATSTGPRAIYEPLPPARILDTRAAGQGPALAGNVPRTLAVSGQGGVPADATAVVLNATIVKPSTAGYLTVYPAGPTRPTVSNINFAQQQTIANLVTVTLGTDGAVNLYIPAGTAHIVVDVAGYYRGHDHDDRYASITHNHDSAYASTTHAHDDRYLTKAQAQARTAANSFTCAVGQVIQAVAADGTPTCVDNTIEKPSPFLGTPSSSLAVLTTFALTTDVFYENVTLNPNSVLRTNGYRIFVRGTLTMGAGSSIQNNGNPGTLNAAGAALSPGSIGGGGAGACATSSGLTNSLGGTGYDGGLPTRPIPAVGGANVFRYLAQALVGRTLDNALVVGGTGGSGGACTGQAPGGGGGGGGVVVVAAGLIVLSGDTATISADGGSSAGAGGGGGGVVVLATQNALPAGLTVRAQGGAGIGWGAGSPGAVLKYAL